MFPEQRYTKTFYNEPKTTVCPARARITVLNGFTSRSEKREYFASARFRILRVLRVLRVLGIPTSTIELLASSVKKKRCVRSSFMATAPPDQVCFDRDSQYVCFVTFLKSRVLKFQRQIWMQNKIVLLYAMNK